MSDVDRFDLEQQIIECWNVTKDIELLESMKASPGDYVSLATLYEYKFQRLWNTFESMLSNDQISNTKPTPFTHDQYTY